MKQKLFKIKHKLDTSERGPMNCTHIYTLKANQSTFVPTYTPSHTPPSLSLSHSLSRALSLHARSLSRALSLSRGDSLDVSHRWLVKEIQASVSFVSSSSSPHRRSSSSSDCAAVKAAAASA